jgi:hypothetical protein
MRIWVASQNATDQPSCRVAFFLRRHLDQANLARTRFTALIAMGVNSSKPPGRTMAAIQNDVVRRVGMDGIVRFAD